MCLAVPLITAAAWKQPGCSSEDEWIRKTWYIHTMEYYSSGKNKVESFVGKWMYFETISLSEINQIQKVKTCMVLLYKKTKV